MRKLSLPYLAASDHPYSSFENLPAIYLEFGGRLGLHQSSVRASEQRNLGLTNNRVATERRDPKATHFGLLGDKVSTPSHYPGA